MILSSLLVSGGRSIVVPDTPVRERWAYAGDRAAFEADNPRRHGMFSPVMEPVAAAWAGLFTDKSVRNHLSRA